MFICIRTREGLQREKYRKKQSRTRRRLCSWLFTVPLFFKILLLHKVQDHTNNGRKRDVQRHDYIMCKCDSTKAFHVQLYESLNIPCIIHVTTYKEHIVNVLINNKMFRVFTQAHDRSFPLVWGDDMLIPNSFRLKYSCARILERMKNIQSW